MIPQDFLNKLNKALGLSESDTSKEVKLKEVEEVKDEGAPEHADKQYDKPPKVGQMQQKEGFETGKKDGKTDVPMSDKTTPHCS